MRDRLIELIETAKCEWKDKVLAKEKVEYLAEYIADHLLASGVIVPPCKVGDVGYYISGIHGTLIKEAKVEEIYFGESGFAFRMCTDYSYFDLQGNEVYFTREEAEKAMERREG